MQMDPYFSYGGLNPVQKSCLNLKQANSILEVDDFLPCVSETILFITQENESGVTKVRRSKPLKMGSWACTLGGKLCSI